MIVMVTGMLLLTGSPYPIGILALAVPVLLIVLVHVTVEVMFRRRFRPSERATQKRLGIGLVLYHTPDIQDEELISTYLRASEQAMEEFVRLFGFTLRRFRRHLHWYDPAVYLFARPATVQRLHGAGHDAFADSTANAMLISVRDLQPNEPKHIVRHELAHLFAARWNAFAPPLFSEGLATWLGGWEDGKPVDYHALTYLLMDVYYPFAWLRARKAFFGAGLQAYALAGSFTGYLVRRYGWKPYEDLYRKVTRRNLAEHFERCFGRPLQGAERDWRDDLLNRRHEFEPDLSLAIAAGKRVEKAFDQRRLYHCVEEGEQLATEGSPSPEALAVVGLAHYWLGDYAKAAFWLERAIAQGDAPPRRKWNSWLFLARSYDLLGRHQEAMPLYKRILNTPDRWYRDWGSLHEHVSHFIDRPFSQAEADAEWDFPRRRGR